MSPPVPGGGRRGVSGLATLGILGVLRPSDGLKRVLVAQGRWQNDAIHGH